MKALAGAHAERAALNWQVESSTVRVEGARWCVMMGVLEALPGVRNCCWQVNVHDGTAMGHESKHNFTLVRWSHYSNTNCRAVSCLFWLDFTTPRSHHYPALNTTSLRCSSACSVCISASTNFCSKQCAHRLRLSSHKTAETYTKEPSHIPASPTKTLLLFVERACTVLASPEQEHPVPPQAHPLQSCSCNSSHLVRVCWHLVQQPAALCHTRHARTS